MTHTHPVVVVTPRSARRFVRQLAEEGPALAAVRAAAARLAGRPMGGDALVPLLLAAARSLEPLGDEAGDVMDSPGLAHGSLLQSALAEFGATRLLDPLPTGGVEARFELEGMDQWLERFRALVAREALGPHPMPAPAPADPLPPRARMALLGDWGMGAYGAPVSASSIQRDPGGFTHLVHLGDIYYAGTAAEVDRFLADWPRVPGSVTRACNGNHEMHSGGDAYFDRLLPEVGQRSSAFAWRNRDWLIAGLDTAWTDHDLDEAQVAWLEQQMNENPGCRVLLFSHHQPFSHLSTQGPRLTSALRRVLGSGRVAAWYWAHEHRAVVYERHARLGLLGRCLGHGGMPEYTAKLARYPREAGPGGSGWRLIPAAGEVPAARVLDGPNPWMGVDAGRFLAQGYAVLTLDGPGLTEEICLADGTVAYRGRVA